MTYTHDFKSFAREIGYSDCSYGLRQSAKLGCFVIGIPCYGLLFVFSIILVVSGIAALSIGNTVSQDSHSNFFDDTLNSAGIIMAISGVLLMATLLCLWYVAETGKYSFNKKQSYVLNSHSQTNELPVENNPCLLSENIYSNDSIENSGMENITQGATAPTPQTAHAAGSQIDPSQSLPTREDTPVMYSNQPSQYPPSSVPSRGQLIFIGPPCGGQLSYPEPPPGYQLPYSEPLQSGQRQISHSTEETIITRLSLPYTLQQQPQNQDCQPQMDPWNNWIPNMPTDSVASSNICVDYPYEFPPPYTP